MKNPALWPGVIVVLEMDWSGQAKTYIRSFAQPHPADAQAAGIDPLRTACENYERL
jgi:hypothetical protein